MAARLLLVVGLLTLGTGIYFLFIRPVMLPEDIRLTGMDPQLLSPGMAEWLRIVFRTWGGFIAGFGILILSVATYMLTSRRALLSWGVALALSVAFGRFLVSNVTIRSDFLWFVGALFVLALLTALRLTFSTRWTSARRSETKEERP
jgi:hypothetical protein